MKDLDELVLSCRTDQARDYIREAMQSYGAGAYRATIVVTWIAVVFDLVDKLRELDGMGDTQAKLVITDFDATLLQLTKGDSAALAKALQFEREILENVRTKFQLLDDYQAVDLRRLFEDRNRCAHPTFDATGSIFIPSAEAARTHVRNAIVHVLQQPPVQGKAAIDAVIARISSKYFPTDPALVKQALEQQIGKARPALVTGLVDRLIFDMFKSNSLYASPSGVVGLRALLDLHRADAEPRVRSQARKVMANASDTELSIACTLVAQIPEAWDGLDAVQRQRFDSYMAGGNIIMVAHLIRMALERPALRQVALGRIAGMNMGDLSQVVAVGVGKEAVERAVWLFSRVGSFNAANQVAAVLILPLMDFITADHLKAIIRSPKEHKSDLRYAGGMALFIDAVRKRQLVSDKELELLLADDFDYLLPPKDQPEASAG